MVKFLRYLRGNVRFNAQGGFANRLIGACMSNGVQIWDITHTDMGFEANAFADEYRKITKLAKKSSTKVRIKNKKGLWFLAFQNRTRWGVLVGALSFIILLGTMSAFVWTVDITGNTTIDEDIIRHQLAELGVKEGIIHKGIDADFVERSMLVQNEKLSWIAVNVEGSWVRVLIKERTMPPDKLHDHSRPANIVALYSGVVRHVEAYTGQAIVTNGDVVAAGDLLISGIIETTNGRTAIKRATGKVIIEHERIIEVAVPFEQTVKTPTAAITIRQRLEALGANIALGSSAPPQGEYETFESSKRVEVMGVKLPIIVHTKSYVSYTSRKIILSEDAAREQALQNLEKEEEALLETEIIDKSVVGMSEDGYFVVVGKYRVREDVALQKEFIAE